MRAEWWWDMTYPSCPVAQGWLGLSAGRRAGTRRVEGIVERWLVGAVGDVVGWRVFEMAARSENHEESLLRAAYVHDALRFNAGLGGDPVSKPPKCDFVSLLRCTVSDGLARQCWFLMLRFEGNPF